jgi:hypothetical protein
MKVSERFLREHARTALMTAASGIRENTCDVVSGEFACLMEEYVDEIYGVVKAPFNGRKHFVAVLPGDEVRFTDDLYVVVDITVKQFEDQTDFTLPEVAVVPSSDPRHDSWYDYVNTPIEKDY